jgi:hypothetical protein
MAIDHKLITKDSVMHMYVGSPMDFSFLQWMHERGVLHADLSVVVDATSTDTTTA